MFLISTLFNPFCLHKFSHHLSIMMILPATKSNLCNPLKENCKNMQSSNYTSYRVICKHRRAVSQIEGDGNISNLIIIAIVQHDDNVDGGRLRSWVSEWRDDGMTKWRNDWMTSWLTEWMTDWSWPDNMPIASTTLGDDTSVQLYAASGFRRSESGSGRHFSWMGERLLGVCHVVYWPVCVSPVHIWIFVAILMNFQGWPRVRGGGMAVWAVPHVRPHDMAVQDATMSTGVLVYGLYGRTTGTFVWQIRGGRRNREWSHCVSRYYGHFGARWCARLFGYLGKSSNLFAIVVDAAIVRKSICVVILTDHFLHFVAAITQCHNVELYP